MRGFTFEQLALLVLVLLGLSLATILATTQFTNVGKSLSSFGRSANSSVGVSSEVSGRAACDLAGGVCVVEGECDSLVFNSDPQYGCQSGEVCCSK